jgi:tyrosine-protein kinase Etk/Wzc
MNERIDNRPHNSSIHFEEEVHLRDYIKVLSSRWKLVAYVFVAIVVATSLYTFGMKPVYQADTLLKVSDKRGAQGVLGELAAVTQTANPVETQIEILKSRSLGAEVVKRLDLDLSVEKTGNGFARLILRKFRLLKADDDLVPRVELLDLPDELIGENLLLITGGKPGYFSLSHEKKLLLKGPVGEMVENGNMRLKLVFDDPATPDSEYHLTRIDIRQATQGLLKRLKVSQVGRNTQVVRVSYQDVDPVRAAMVLDTLQEAYIQRDIGEAATEANATLDFIMQQRTLVKDRLERAQEALDDYKVRTGTVALSQEAELLVQRISDMEVEANQLLVTRKGMDLLVESLGREGGISAGSTEALGFQSPEFTDLVSGYLGLQRKRGELLKEYTSDHPVIQSVDAQILLAADQIRATASAIKGAMRNREMAVKGVLDTYRAKLDTLPDIERQLAKFAKDVLIQEKIYSFLLEKEQEVRIVKASTVSQIRVVDPATVPIMPIKPNKKRNILLAVILGMMLGMGCAFTLEYFDDTVKSDSDMELLVGVPLYGTVPFLKEARDRRKQRKPHLVIEEPRSPVTEAFRILRTNILFSRVGESPKVVTVTSAGPGEGKSFIVANLAAISSYAAKRTIVIDADLRKPQQDVVFGALQKPGLTEVLTGKINLAEAIQNTSQGMPSLLAAGSISPNPSELLGSTYMGNLINQLKKDYEFIVIDSPPLGMVTDPALLMTHTDMGLIIVRADVTRKRNISRAVDTLRKTSPDKQLGIVINAGRFSGENGYGYNYGKAYGGK